MHPDGQPELDFSSNSVEKGYDQWQEQRRSAMRELSQKMGLPLGRKVEVWLRGFPRPLVGVLRLGEEQLFVPEDRNPVLQLIVDNVPFVPGEMTSCVALE